MVPVYLDPVLLHLEEMGEVRVQLKSNGAGGPLDPEIANDDVLAHAVAHVSAAFDEHRAVGLSGSRLASGDKGRCEWVSRDHGKVLQFVAVESYSPG